VSDGTATSGTQSLSFVVTGTNDAPVLTNANPSLSGTSQTTGFQVSSFLSSTDVDIGALKGIAIFGQAAVNPATWQYSTDGGATWNPVGTVSNTSALLLRDTDLVRLDKNNKSGTLNFKAWDRTSGTFGTYVDTSANGGTSAFSSTNGTLSASTPAGIAGQPINLALADPSADPTDSITLTITAVPSDWTVNDGTKLADGSWTVQTTDPSALTVTTAATYTGAMVLNVAQSWTNPDGSTGSASIADNVEAYAPSSPIFALSSKDVLTGSAGNDLFVFAQPISDDTIHTFDAASDRIDLIGFTAVAGYGDLQIAADVNGDAVITVGTSETITVKGLDAAALGPGNFVFDQEPTTENPGSLTIGNGAILPVGGTINNTGTVALNAAGDETDLEILVRGATLTGGGQVILSDSSQNVVFSGDASAVLDNVDNTISGAGQVGNGQLTLKNEGVIEATGANALVIDTGSNAIVNTGTLAASGPGGLVVNSAVTGGGSAKIGDGSNLEFGAASDAKVDFDTGATGTLKLDQSSAFTGVVVGFTGYQAIDVADLVGGEQATIGYAANADDSGGILTLGDAAQTHSVCLALLGQYAAADFVVASNGHGGTLVSLADPSQTHAFTLANAAH
jgi:hypothetical protein